MRLVKIFEGRSSLSLHVTDTKTTKIIGLRESIDEIERIHEKQLRSKEEITRATLGTRKLYRNITEDWRGSQKYRTLVLSNRVSQLKGRN